MTGGDELSSQARFTIGGKTAEKRFVLRLPAKWNGSLVIGAHGGSGGNAVDRTGKVYATSETALDDVIGEYAFAQGFAYASVDRDGVGGSDEGAVLTVAFLAKADGEILKRDQPAAGPAFPGRAIRGRGHYSQDRRRHAGWRGRRRADHRRRGR